MGAIAVAVVVVVALGVVLLGRVLRGGGASLTAQVTAVAAQYPKPAAALAVADLALGGHATLEAVGRGGELTIWLEHAVETKGGLLASGDWSLALVLTTDAGEQRIALEYDGEDVRVTPRQIGVTGVPSSWPGHSGKTRIATLGAPSAGTPVRIAAATGASRGIVSARLAISIETS